MSEKDYDEVIAPMLLAVAKKCEELGMCLIARVEWEPGEYGITQSGDNDWSSGQRMTKYAAHSRGNVDALLLTLIRNCDVSGSMFLHSYNRSDAVLKEKVER